MNKKMLIAMCLLQLGSLSSTVAFASPETSSATADESKVVSVDKCPALSKITTEYVKFIGEDNEETQFLDKNGNKVVPCKNNDLVYFFIVDKYPDGKELFEASKNPVLNKSFYDNAISINLDTNTKISYGKPHLEVTDIYDFQAQLNREELKESTGDVTLVEAEKTIPSGMEQYMSLSTEMLNNTPAKYLDMTTPEKRRAMSELYSKLTDTVKSKAQTELASAKQQFTKDAITNNRVIKPTQKVINQYDYDADLLELTDEKGNPLIDTNQKDTVNPNYDKIDGYLYLKYKSTLANAKFFNAYKDFVSQTVCSNAYSLDQKISFLEFLIKDDSIITNSAHLYKKSIDDFIANNAQKHDVLNNQGLSEYNTIDNADKMAYYELVKTINNGIINNEFNELPSVITNKQYKALSNIDKYKYAPTREGHFVDKSKYTKNELDLVMKYKI